MTDQEKASDLEAMFVRMAAKVRAEAEAEAEPECEHTFSGWREFKDGRGGEQVCSKCGLGALDHSLALDWT